MGELRFIMALKENMLLYFFLTFRLYTIKKYPYYTEELFLLNMYSFFPISALFVEDFFYCTFRRLFLFVCFFFEFRKEVWILSRSTWELFFNAPRTPSHQLSLGVSKASWIFWTWWWHWRHISWPTKNWGIF